jgi:uncharacterized protein YbaR (Trm112 family)/SAM-dependent methyltransferase
VLKVYQHVPSREWVLRRLAIKRGDLVLDVGSGQAPFGRADVLCDRFLECDEQRPSEFVSAGKTVVVGDAHALPFRSGALDYVFASQVLEHLDDPGRFLAEVMRVGKGGYIECPSELRERMFGWEFHRWTVSVEDDVLVLRPNDHERLWGNTFYRLSARRPHWRHLYDREYDVFNLMVEWEGEIPFRIEEKVGTGIVRDEPFVPEDEKALRFGVRPDTILDRWDDFRFGLSRLFPVGAALRRARLHLRRGRRPRALSDRILSILACPYCNGCLARKDDSLVCGCGRTYAVIGGVPRLLVDEVEKN